MSVFENQFGEENGSLVYRRYGKGVAYRVSEFQRDTLIEGYIADYRKNAIITTCTIGGIFATMIALIVAGLSPDDSLLWGFLGVAFAAIVGWFTWQNHRAIRKPELTFNHTAPTAPALNRAEASSKALGQLSYSQLALAPAIGLFLVWTFSDKFDIWSGYGRAVWLVPIAFLTLATVQAIRKYRLERQKY